MIPSLPGMLGIGAKLPVFNPAYCFVVQWQYDEDNNPIPTEETFQTAGDALNAMIQIWNTNKTLVHLSISRRNA